MHIHGLIAAPFTAMDEEGNIDLELIEKQAELLYHNGVKGAFVCGTTGESLSLTHAERKNVAARWVQVAPADFKVIVHVGHTCLPECRSLAAHAQQIGAWGIGAMGPCFFKPETVDDLVAFCAEIAAAAPHLPFYYYHMPAITGVAFPMIDFLEKAASRIPTLAGIKYTNENLMDYQACRLFQPQRYDMLFGRDEILLSALVLGARGAVGSTYNFAAPLYYQIIEAFEKGNLPRAQSLQTRSMDMVRVLQNVKGSFLAAGKAVMKYVGIDCGPVRLPLQNLAPGEYEKMVIELEELDFSSIKVEYPVTT